MTPTAELLETVGSGVYAWKGAPGYGRQDLGYSPGGAQDRFSYRCGNILLENDASQPALEMVLPPQAVRFRADCCFVLTGGRLEATLHHAAGSRRRDDACPHPLDAGPHCDGRALGHAVVHLARSGDEIRFGRRSYGWRSYLCCRPAPQDSARLVRRERGAFARVFRWPDRSGKIRVLHGPEVDCLEDPEAFVRADWMTTNDMSDMGIRLSAAAADRALSATAQEAAMVSAPVCDGTIQMTPAGPIVLLRDRQTVGGYPRVWVVISADVDLLAQYGPQQRMRFAAVTLQDARIVAATQAEDLERLAEQQS